MASEYLIFYLVDPYNTDYKTFKYDIGNITTQSTAPRLQQLGNNRSDH